MGSARLCAGPPRRLVKKGPVFRWSVTPLPSPSVPQTGVFKIEAGRPVCEDCRQRLSCAGGGPAPSRALSFLASWPPVKCFAFSAYSKGKQSTTGICVYFVCTMNNAINPRFPEIYHFMFHRRWTLYSFVHVCLSHSTHVHGYVYLVTPGGTGFQGKISFHFI